MMARYNKKQKSTPLAGSSGENSLNQNPSFPLANNTLVSKKRMDEGKYKCTERDCNKTFDLMRRLMTHIKFCHTPSLKRNEIDKSTKNKKQSKGHNKVLSLRQSQKVIEDLSREVSEYQNKFEVLQKRWESTKKKERTFKTSVKDLLESNFKCIICSEVIFKPHTAKCCHTFCEVCIMKWISVNHNCPVCRSPIKKTHYCRVMDDFITSLCNMLGGSTKFQRDDIIRERTLSSGNAAPSRRRRQAPFVDVTEHY